jgi:hypothetical protein
MNFLSIRKAALAIVFAIAAPVMHAQYYPSNDIAVVNVPFDFQVGSVHLASGKYSFSSPRMGLLQIRGASTAFTLTHRDVDDKPGTKTIVRFHKVGGKYFLAEVHKAGSANFIECVESSDEAVAQKADAALRNTMRASLEVETVQALP